MYRISELEGLRGLLAVWVVIVHLMPAAGLDVSSFGIFKPLFGELIRVQIFCIMSGFVIFMMLSRSHENYGTYLKRRFLRIYPVYILAFTLSVLVSAIAYEALANADFGGEHNRLRMTILQDSFLSWPWHFAAHLTMTHGIIPDPWLPSGAYAFLGQGWNISTEFQFYVIAPLVFWIFHLRSNLVKGLAVAAIVAIWWIFRNWPNNADLVQFAIYFAAGIASFYAGKLRWTDRRVCNRWTVIFASIAVGFFNIALGAWIFIYASALIVRDQDVAPGLLATFLQTPIMLWLGSISYALYLLHMVPLYLSMYILNLFSLTQPVYFAAIATMTFATAIPLALYANKYVETAFYRSETRRPQELVTRPAE